MKAPSLRALATGFGVEYRDVRAIAHAEGHFAGRRRNRPPLSQEAIDAAVLATRRISTGMLNIHYQQLMADIRRRARELNRG